MFSEKTEMIFGRHIAVIILCSIYAVTKLVNHIKFIEIKNEYWKVFEEDEGIFSALKLRDGEVVDIVEFYNKEFIQTMKYFIDDRVQTINPRVALLNPQSSLMEQINGATSSKKSPFTTPRTKYLLASPGNNGKLLCKGKILNFEHSEVPKIPRFVEMMLLENNEGIIPMPVIKKN